MRYIFILLLSANIAFLGWHQFLKESEPADARATGEHPNGDMFATENTVFLLSEPGNDMEREAELVGMVQSAQVGSGAMDAGCLAAGPFEDMGMARDAAERLTSLDLDSEVKAIDEPTGENDYRVMIPPATSLQDAFRKLKELKAQGIDSYVITKGSDALGISLGVFSTREGAETLADNRQKGGYEVEITEIARLNREYWIFSTESTDLEIPSPVWTSLQASHSGLERRRMACNQ
ncbi:MAG: SPOR domain-containing protein [Pseudomonadales bacterium]